MKVNLQSIHPVLASSDVAASIVLLDDDVPVLLGEVKRL